MSILLAQKGFSSPSILLMVQFIAYKVRLVAQGFTHILGFNFTHIFSPLVKASTVHIVLSLAVMNNWPLQQLDVNNIFCMVFWVSQFIWSSLPVIRIFDFPLMFVFLKRPFTNLSRQLGHGSIGSAHSCLHSNSSIVRATPPCSYFTRIHLPFTYFCISMTSSS